MRAKLAQGLLLVATKGITKQNGLLKLCRD